MKTMWNIETMVENEMRGLLAQREAEGWTIHSIIYTGSINNVYAYYKVFMKRDI